MLRVPRLLGKTPSLRVLGGQLGSISMLSNVITMFWWNPSSPGLRAGPPQRRQRRGGVGHLSTAAAAAGDRGVPQIHQAPVRFLGVKNEWSWAIRKIMWKMIYQNNPTFRSWVVSDSFWGWWGVTLDEFMRERRVSNWIEIIVQT